MNAKRKGTRNEHKSRDLLIAHGFRVTRAGGSLGVWDLIAIGPSSIALVQVKTNRGPSPREMERMLKFPAPRECVRVVHIWKDRAREPIVKILGLAA